MSSLTSTPSLRQLLSLEDDPELLGHLCHGTGIPAWPLVRVEFIRTIMSELLFKTASLTAGYQQRPYKQALGYVPRSLAHNAMHRNDYQSDICLFTSGLGNFVRNGQTFERLAGYFANIYPENSLIYQDHGGWRWHRHYQFPRVLYATPFNLAAQLAARVAVGARHRALADAVVGRAAANANSRLGHVVQPADLAGLARSLARQLAMLPFVTEYYAKWFARRKIKLLLKEDASYGGRSVAVLAAARLAGVPIAEYQHGAISAGHDGYNVAPALANSEAFRQALPDYLLTYGEWWGEQTNLPVRKVVVGNPHFTESTKHIGTSGRGRRDILILGDGIETELYLDLAGRVARIAASRGLRVVFRPHPIERQRAASATLPPGVELDKNSDVYQSFAETGIVISELSTGLFEAAGLVERVVMWDTEKARFAFPQLPFPAFAEYGELEQALFGAAEHADNGVAGSRIWADNWQLNYKNFVESVLST